KIFGTSKNLLFHPRINGYGNRLISSSLRAKQRFNDITVIHIDMHQLDKSREVLLNATTRV
ncbi:hypothetical protein, partial [Burkholderia mallei]|uniref:hypothetical protein n=1 Tax=Burkholderia mallei TaxID=13373 RepID=UPI001E5CD08A